MDAAAVASSLPSSSLPNDGMWATVWSLSDKQDELVTAAAGSVAPSSFFHHLAANEDEDGNALLYARGEAGEEEDAHEEDGSGGEEGRASMQRRDFRTRRSHSQPSRLISEEEGSDEQLGSPPLTEQYASTASAAAAAASAGAAAISTKSPSRAGKRSSMAGSIVASPQNEDHSHSQPHITLTKGGRGSHAKRQILLPKSGKYSLEVSLPPELNAACYDKILYKWGKRHKDGTPRFRVHCFVEVDGVRGEKLPLACTESGAGTEASPCVNPEHTMCVIDFEVPEDSVPACCKFHVESHTPHFAFKVAADLLRCQGGSEIDPESAALLPEIAPAVLKRGSSEGDDNDEASDSTTPMPSLKTEGAWFREIRFPGDDSGKPGRRILLRGVNLSGNCKLPMSPVGYTHLNQHWNALKFPEVAQSISFVGRPFPLEEAREHFARLQKWGFNCVRFLVTWEAIEHAGPGKYDVAYLDYLEKVVGMAGEYSIYVFIDPHQDTWSRMSGGSGAPAWTFEVAGLDVGALEEAGAAFTMSMSPNPEKFKKMTWPQNYQRFACLHMFTMFFGGNDFAPKLMVPVTPSEGERVQSTELPIQEFLQRHFISAIVQVAKRVAKFPHVLGFDPFNEPSPGFIGCQLNKPPEPIIPPGAVVYPIDAMISASGIPREVGYVNKLLMSSGKRTLNPTRRSVWLPEDPERGRYGDIWRLHGVWRLTLVEKKTGKAPAPGKDDEDHPKEDADAAADSEVRDAIGDGKSESGGGGADASVDDPPRSGHVPAHETRKTRKNSDECIEIPELLQPKYFMYHPNGDKIDFFRDYLRPFMVRYICRMRDILPRAILFAEGDGFGQQEFPWLGMDPDNTVNTTHWYDGFTLFKRSYNSHFTIDTKHKRPVFGRGAVKRMHRRDLSFIVNLPKDEDGNRVVMPTLLGEFGIPFDLNAREGYRKGKYKSHISALSMYYDIFDELQIHSTQWNYCCDNSNQWGDNWNREDLSIFSRDQQLVESTVSLDSGGRALQGFCRPYAPITCGIPLKTRFKRRAGEFLFEYAPDAENFKAGCRCYATEIYVPDVQFTQHTRRGASMSGAFVSFNIFVENGTYAKRRFPGGYHIVYVWAATVPEAADEQQQLENEVDDKLDDAGEPVPVKQNAQNEDINGRGTAVVVVRITRGAHVKYQNSKRRRRSTQAFASPS